MTKSKKNVGRKPQTKYGLKIDGSPLYAFVFNWRDVKWDTTAPPKYTASDISRKLCERFPKSFKLPASTISQYFHDGRWPFAYIRFPDGGFIRGMSDPNLEKVIEIFASRCFFDSDINMSKSSGSFKSAEHKKFSYTNIDDKVIIADGLTTVQASKYLWTHYKLRLSYKGLRYLCHAKQNPIPYSKRNGYFRPEKVYVFYPTHLDEYAAIKKREKELAEQKAGNGSLETNENSSAVVRDANWRGAVGVEVSQHSRDISDLKQEITKLKKELSELKNETASSIKTVGARIEKVSEYVVTVTSWLNEQFPNEFAVCCG